MTDDKGKDGGEQQDEQGGVAERPPNVALRKRVSRTQGETPPTPKYDFSHLKDEHPSTVAFEYMDKGWRIVPIDRATGEVVVLANDDVDETVDIPLIPSWTDDPEQLQRLYQPFPPDLLTAYKVPNLVNNPRFDSPACITQV